MDIDIKGYNDLWDASLEDSIALTANYRVLNGITNLALGQDLMTRIQMISPKQGEASGVSTKRASDSGMTIHRMRFLMGKQVLPSFIHLR